MKQYTETSTLLKTEQKQVDDARSKAVELPSTRPRPDETDGGGGPVNGPPRDRTYASDSEDPMSWLDEQKGRLRTGRPGWRVRSARDRQLVTELRSAQTAFRGSRPRTYSESEMLDKAGLPRRGRRSEPTSTTLQSDRYELRPARFVSGLERRPFTTQQTMYTFGVSPQRAASLDHGLYDSPAVPERDDSSRDAMARRRRSQGMC